MFVPSCPDSAEGKLHEVLERAVKDGGLGELRDEFLRVRMPEDVLFGCIKRACINDHIPVAQWIHQTFDVVRSKAKLFRYNVLEKTCEAGRLFVMQWLCYTYDITRADLRSRCMALCSACAGGHLHIVQWLIKNYCLTAADMTISCTLEGACAGGHLRLAQWLHDTFGLTFAPRSANIRPI
jgi:hypothetical protein